MRGPLYFTGMLRLNVLLFASYADAFHAPRLDVTLPEGATVADLLTQLRTMAPDTPLPLVPLVAVNQRYATTAESLHAGDEVALIPPVAGG